VRQPRTLCDGVNDKTNRPASIMGNNLLRVRSQLVAIHPIDMAVQRNPNAVSLVARTVILPDTIGWRRQQHQAIQAALQVLQIGNQPARGLVVRSPECGIERSECLFKLASDRIDATTVAKNTHTLVNVIQSVSIPKT
jgi:hypothetical protein